MPGYEAVDIAWGGGFLVMGGTVGVIGVGIAEDSGAHANKKICRGWIIVYIK